MQPFGKSLPFLSEKLHCKHENGPDAKRYGNFAQQLTQASEETIKLFKKFTRQEARLRPARAALGPPGQTLLFA